MNLYIVQASIRFHSWDFARKTLWPFLARSKLKTFPVFTYSFFPYEQSQSHNPKLWADNWTFSFCLKGGNLFVGILSCFLRNDQKIVAFFLALKDREKNGKQLFRCHEKCSWDKRRSKHVQHVCGQREAVNFTLMFLRLLIHVSSNSSLNLFHPIVGSLKSEKSKR